MKSPMGKAIADDLVIHMPSEHETDSGSIKSEWRGQLLNPMTVFF